MFKLSRLLFHNYDTYNFQIVDANDVFVDDNVDDSEMILFTYFLNLIQNMYMLCVRWFKESTYFTYLFIPVDYVTVGTDIATH